MKRIYIAGVLGEVVEWYDFSLYSFLSPLFVTLFFPHANPMAGLLGVFAIFAAGFFSRPLGALWFGWLGDAKGRKSAFFMSLSLMAIPTCLMGCLPTYQQVGIAAPIALLVLRLLQGFSCGGEFSLSMIFLSEHATQKNYFFAGSLAWMGMMLGALLASLMITSLSLQDAFLSDWGWRIPFFCGAFMAVVGAIFRHYTVETPVFLTLKKLPVQSIKKFAFLKKYPGEMLKIFFLNAPVAALSYVGVAFFPAFLTKFVGLSFYEALIITTSIIFMLILLIPLAGCLADKIGGKKVLLLSLILLLSNIYPAYALFAYSHSMVGYAIAILLFIIPAALIQSVVPGLSVQAAPVASRAVVMSFAYNVTYSILGGTAPLIMSYFIGQWHLILMPAYYIFFFAAIALLVFSRAKIACPLIRLRYNRTKTALKK